MYPGRCETRRKLRNGGKGKGEGGRIKQLYLRVVRRLRSFRRRVPLTLYPLPFTLFNCSPLPVVLSVILSRMSEQTCEPIQPPTLDNDLLDPYERLVSIEVLGKQVEVPEKSRLLRCFQFLSLNTISYGDFCWNGDCTNCQIWYHSEGHSKENDKPGLSCRMEVIEGMKITSMSPFIKLEGITK